MSALLLQLPLKLRSLSAARLFARPQSALELHVKYSRYSSNLAGDIAKVNSKTINFTILYDTPESISSAEETSTDSTEDIEQQASDLSLASQSPTVKQDDAMVEEAINKFFEKSDMSTLPQDEPVNEYHAFDYLARLLSDNKNATVLPSYKFSKSLESPYNVLKKQTGKSRISITGVTPNSWCELQKFYTLYAAIKTPSTNATVRGTTFHLVAERETHPVKKIVVDNDFIPPESISGKVGKEETPVVDLAKSQFDHTIRELDIKKSAYPTTQRRRLKMIRQRMVGAKLLKSKLKPLWKAKIEFFEKKPVKPHLKIRPRNLEVRLSSSGRLNYLKKYYTNHKEKAVALQILMNGVAGLLKGQNMGVSSHNRIAFQWSRNILRLSELFLYGDCREILIHGMYNIDNMSLVKDDNESSDYTSNEYCMISGILDHISLDSNVLNAKNEYLQDIKESFRHSKDSYYDLNSIMPIVRKVSRAWCDDNSPLVFASIKDLKTRAGRSLPSPSLVENSKVQVSFYRLIIGILAGEGEHGIRGEDEAAKFAYKLMIANAKNRGFDVDAPLKEDMVVFLGMNNKYILNDFQRLQQGSHIGFEPFDDDMEARTDSGQFSLAFLDHLRPNFKEFNSLSNYVVKSLDRSLFAEWQTTPTLRYLLARNAQLYALFAKYLSKEQSLEYASKGQVFKEIAFQYDKEKTDNYLEYGMKFWLGQRHPRHTNVDYPCKTCTFKHQCQHYNEQNLF